MDRKQEVSVILPVYNGGAFLRECIESVLNQSVEPKELIIIDDGSTDDSSDIIREFPQVSHIIQKNVGVAETRNIGLKKASGNLIAFIDQDDFWALDKLEQQLQYLNQNSEAQVVIGHQKCFLDGLNELPSWVKPELFDKPVGGYLLGCALLKGNVFSEIGTFDSSLRFGSDTDWFFKLTDAGIETHTVDAIVLHKRIHDSNESRFAEESLKELTRIIHRSIIRKKQQQLKTTD